MKEKKEQRFLTGRHPGWAPVAEALGIPGAVKDLTVCVPAMGLVEVTVTFIPYESDGALPAALKDALAGQSDPAEPPAAQA